MASQQTTDLLLAITSNTKIYEGYYQSKEVPMPTHRGVPGGAISQLPAPIEAARMAAKEACAELHELLSAPQEIIMDAGPAVGYLDSYRVTTLGILLTEVRALE